MGNVWVWLVMAVLACVGFIQTATWIAIRAAGKGNKIYRIIPIGGEGKRPGNQMSLMYTCLQWESNPSRQVYVLYDAGLNEQNQKDCEALARSAGALFVRSAEELSALLESNSK